MTLPTPEVLHAAADLLHRIAYVNGGALTAAEAELPEIPYPVAPRGESPTAARVRARHVIRDAIEDRATSGTQFAETLDGVVMALARAGLLTPIPAAEPEPEIPLMPRSVERLDGDVPGLPAGTDPAVARAARDLIHDMAKAGGAKLSTLANNTTVVLAEFGLLR